MMFIDPRLSRKMLSSILIFVSICIFILPKLTALLLLALGFALRKEAAILAAIKMVRNFQQKHR